MENKDNQDILIASAKIAKAAQDAAELTTKAVETAKNLIEEAATRAEELVTRQRVSTTETIVDALKKVFDSEVESGQFIDVRKIPLICLKIVDINKQIDSINDSIKWVVRLIIGATILGILALLFK